MKNIIEVSQTEVSFEIGKAKDELDKVNKKLYQYINEVGIENSKFTPREQSDQIALLTELVLTDQIQNLFPISTNSAKPRASMTTDDISLDIRKR